MNKHTESLQMRRFLTVTIVFTVFLLAIIARLYYLQVVKGSYYASVAEDNRLRIISTDAPRGEIKDCNGVVLATDIPSFDIAVTTYDLKNIDQELTTVAKLTGTKLQVLKHTVNKAGVGPFTPITIVRNVSKTIALKLAEQEPDLPGIQLVMSTKRYYPQGTMAAHVLGYTGAISDTEYKQLQSKGYTSQDTLGKDGIESQYESLLRGQKSQKLIEVDSEGNVVKTLQEKAAVPGKSLQLTIDTRLQKECESVLGGNPGAAIMMNPQNGEILALASSPSFNPNKFISGVSAADWKAWSTNQALFDRAVNGSLPPGSTFKVLTGTAGLETHTITDSTIIRCRGSLTVGGILFKCWIWPGGHGNENIYRAYADSCDTYFYTVARMVGIQNMDAYANKFGLNNLTGIDLPGEITSSYGTPAWKEKTLKEPWYIGDTMNMGIGQGYTLLTPIRNLSIYSSIAMNGTLWRPHLLKSSTDSVTNAKTVTTPVVQSTLGVSSSTLAAVKKGLNLVTKTGGDALVQVKGVELCAKTGTAETNTAGNVDTWFIAFGPMKNPKVVALIMFENSPYARSTSMAPLMHRLLQKYFDLYGGKNGVN